jgi:hypothetical protein
MYSRCFKLPLHLICSYWQSVVTPPIEQTTCLVHLQFIYYLIGQSPQIYRVVLNSSPPCSPPLLFPVVRQQTQQCCHRPSHLTLSPLHSIPGPSFLRFSLCRPFNALYLFLQLRHDCNIIVAGRSHIRAGLTWWPSQVLRSARRVQFGKVLASLHLKH